MILRQNQRLGPEELAVQIDARPDAAHTEELSSPQEKKFIKNKSNKMNNIDIHRHNMSLLRADFMNHLCYIFIRFSVEAGCQPYSSTFQFINPYGGKNYAYHSLGSFSGSELSAKPRQLTVARSEQ
jgi:hypothetical protein